ncbi:MAG: hydrogenase maturation nickel metallochaperone HypA, partial [Deltaproteobacteria bacterium]|nr:hydrogenase maturation nickel metallochaperone HypA [Deltaproteobacteria bacterium]
MGIPEGEIFRSIALRRIRDKGRRRACRMLDARPRLRYFPAMHEMAVVTSLLALVGEELAKRRLEKLLVARVRHGALANIVPEAMCFAFEALTQGGPFERARLELEEDPVVLRCSCGASFSPEHKRDPLFF